MSRARPIPRRAFLAGAGASIVAGRAWAQQRGRLPRLAIVDPARPVTDIAIGRTQEYHWLLSELRRLGYVEGETIAIERWSFGGQGVRYAELAKQVVATRPDVLFPTGTTLVLAFKAATTTIPIVSVVGTAIETGIASSLSRPGGNITGFLSSAEGFEIYAKHLQMLAEAAPSIRRVGWLGPRDLWDTPGASPDGVRKGADVLGLTLVPIFTPKPTVENGIRLAFAEAATAALQAIYIGGAIELRGSAEIIALVADLAKAGRLPSISAFDTFTRAGALMSYGGKLEPQWRGVAGYIDRIIKGTKPGDLPIQQPMLFDLIINKRTADALGLEIPLGLWVQATEILE